MFQIEIKGLDAVILKLQLLGKLNFLKAALKAGGTYIKGKISIPPGVRRLTRAEVYGETFKSNAQQRFFFGAWDAGIIDFPYIRNQSASSQGITKRWTVKGSSDGLTVTVGNNAGYGELVHGETGKQSEYLAAVGWKQSGEVAKEEEPVVVKMINEAVRKECAK